MRTALNSDFTVTEAPFTRRRCENDRYEIVSIRKEIFPDRRSCLHEDDPYPQTFEDDTKTIEKVETFEDDTETIGHRLRVNTISG